MRQETIGQYYELFLTKPKGFPYQFVIHFDEPGAEEVIFQFEEEVDWITFLSLPLSFIQETVERVDPSPGEAIDVHAETLRNERLN